MGNKRKQWKAHVWCGQYMQRFLWKGIAGAIILAFFWSIPVQASPEEPVIVVLDPGHGGENLGAEYESYTEKDMTLILAQAMKEELEKYEGIEVYLTREDDRDMSLKQRVDYADSLHADFLFCLHFNMSVRHDLFGAEVWVSAFDEEYSRGYSFASVMMDQFTEMGLYSRGIKTKLNEEGTDYYGILRHAQATDLSAALIEHCHLDQANDQPFYGTDEQLREFGILDATAVAKYYGLKSEELGVDYSDYRNVEVPIPDGPVRPDKTRPDVCTIDVIDVKDETGEITVSVSAEDYDSYILYYSYSYNGGKFFSDLQKWEPRDSDTQTFTFKIPEGMMPGMMPEIIVRAYNGFDGFTESNHYNLPSIKYGKDILAASTTNVETEKPEGEYEEVTWSADTSSDEEGENTERLSAGYFLTAALISIAALLILILLAKVLTTVFSKKKRRRKK